MCRLCFARGRMCAWLTDGVTTTGRGCWGMFPMEGGRAVFALSHCRGRAQVSSGMELKQSWWTAQGWQLAQCPWSVQLCVPAELPAALTLLLLQEPGGCFPGVAQAASPH